MISSPPPPPPPQPMYNYNPYGGYQGYPQPGMYNGQYMQPPPQHGYGGYMGQPNPYMNNGYGQQPGMYQTSPQGYGGYMAQTNTGYMNQSYPAQGPQQFSNQYNSYRK